MIEPVPHRYVVLTMPRLLRPLFRKRRELLLDLARCAAEAVAEYARRQVGEQARPGIVVSIATSGDLLQWHPHRHLPTTEGTFSDDGAFHPIESWDAEAVMKHAGDSRLGQLFQAQLGQVPLCLFRLRLLPVGARHQGRPA